MYYCEYGCWFGDEVTPKLFRDELMSGSGDVTVWVNSPGGDVFAGVEIYNMLKAYPGQVTVKIDALAASAASVVAMAGDKIYMTPVSFMWIHNPSMLAWGDSHEMERAKNTLDEVKEGIINAYEVRTGISRAVLSHMMDDDEPMSAWKAVSHGFAGGVMGADGEIIVKENLKRTQNSVAEFARVITAFAGPDKRMIMAMNPPPAGPQGAEEPPSEPKGTPTKPLYERLNLLTGGK